MHGSDTHLQYRHRAIVATTRDTCTSEYVELKTVCACIPPSSLYHITYTGRRSWQLPMCDLERSWHVAGASVLHINNITRAAPTAERPYELVSSRTWFSRDVQLDGLPAEGARQPRLHRAHRSVAAGGEAAWAASDGEMASGERWREMARRWRGDGEEMVIRWRCVRLRACACVCTARRGARTI